MVKVADLKKFLADNIPSTGRSGRWLRRKLALDRRWSVRYNKGTFERTGFYTRAEAEGWLERHNYNGISQYYNAIDLRILDDEKTHANHKPHFVGDLRRPQR